MMGYKGMGWAGLGWAGLGWAGLGWAGLGFVALHGAKTEKCTSAAGVRVNTLQLPYGTK
jgi:hypothetical protein